MKTVLYRPVFINPQAYYVFPQLYDIEPRRNNIYKEQAIFAGRIDVYDVNSPDNVEHLKHQRDRSQLICKQTYQNRPIH